MKQIHYSPAPLKRLLNKQQVPPFDEGGAKPHGLWFSIGDAWKIYVNEREDWDQSATAFETEIIFGPTAKILRLEGCKDIDALTSDDFPDWRGIAGKFDAIVISPLCAERRHPSHWYGRWDVPSGCIWNAGAATLWPLNYRTP
jgi:hypothetical protein